ncbi:MAG: aminomethyl-transferring glycine dehydrogenase subunit GcvPB [Gammaproteobacteria bacterium]
MTMTEPIIFEYQGSRRQPFTPLSEVPANLPEDALRQDQLLMPQVSELQVVRHYTRLSQLNYSIDTNFYPLGSCTMKYNPRICNRLAMLPGFLARHPLAPEEQGQGFMQCLFELQQMLQQVTGMAEVSLTPMAGAQGELAGVAMIRAYHLSRGDGDRRQIIVPDAAHGTNPATATMCGCEVVEVATRPDGDLDLDALRTILGPKTAGIMLTNPSTLGVFERQIEAIAAAVHDVGGLLYYDGANLNAILGKILPVDMGFDVVHVNLHKTFSTPHGGGGPGSGAVGVGERLRPYLPVPIVERRDGAYVWADESDRPQTIGRLSTYMGNAGVLLRAYVYLRMLGDEGMQRVADFATLNANYLMTCLAEADFELAFPERRASHEFIVTLKKVTRDTGVKAMDFAKALLDRGMHAPTTYFPLMVPECLLIEPTETESKQVLDAFVASLVELRELAYSDPQQLTTAPHSTPVRRLDDVRAAKHPDLAWRGAPKPTSK